MNLLSLYQTLEFIDSRRAKDVAKEQVIYLRNNGMVNTISEERYKALEDTVKKIGDLNKKYYALRDTNHKLDSEIFDLDYKLGSNWHRMWAGKKVETETLKLYQNTVEYERINQEIKRIEKQLKQARKIQEVIEVYTPQNGQHIALTESGKLLLEIADSGLVQKKGITTSYQLRKYGFDVIDGKEYVPWHKWVGGGIDEDTSWSYTTGENRRIRERKKEQLTSILNRLNLSLM